MANTRCPLCGKPNPIEAEICQFCNARLKPLVKTPNSQADSSFGDSQDQESNLPEWLRDLRQQGDESQPTGENSEAVPDWMSSALSSGIAEPSSPASFEEEQEGFPDWLSRINGGSEADAPSQASQEAAEPPAPSSSGIAEEPDWLKRIRARQQVDGPSVLPEGLEDSDEAAFQAAGEPAETAAYDFPDWLSNPGAQEDEHPTQPVEDLPDWFSQGQGVDVSPVAALDDAEAGDEAVPGWLSNLGMPGLTSDGKPLSFESTAIEEDEPPAAAEKMPDWFSQIEQFELPESDSPSAAPAEEAAPVFFAEDEKEQIDESELSSMPDWISQVSSEDVPGSAPHLDTEAGAPLPQADLPTWLEAMRPVASPESGAKEESTGPAESSGPLAGLRSVLPAEKEFVTIRKPPAYSIRLQVSESQRLHVALVEKMLASEGEAKSTPARPMISSQYLLRLLIAVILLAAVALPQILNYHMLPPARFQPKGIQETYSLIATLPVGAPVLVAFDYDPGFTSELDATSSALIDQLFAKGAHLTLVSTTPTGPAVAQRFIESLQTRQLVSGIDYANLGYISGGATGLLSFAQTPRQVLPFSLDARTVWDSSPLDTISTAADFALVVVITEKADVARTWIEQVEPVLLAKNKKMVMVVSAQAEPLVRPYFDGAGKQLGGLVAGLSGGSVYETLPGLSGGRVRSYWDGYGIGIFTAVVLMAFGGLISAIFAVLTGHKDAEVEVSL